MENIEIVITVRERGGTGEPIARRVALSFEGAEEDLGKLERYVSGIALKNGKNSDNKVCSVCRVEVVPPLQWWDTVNACSDCVRRAAIDIQKEEKNAIKI